MSVNKQFAKIFHASKTKAINSITKCFHPECNNESINSHILQKNGILTSIAEEGHVIESTNNLFYDNTTRFIKTGINKAFSFRCFCSYHDDVLFKTIEQNELDILNYRNQLLFTLRTIYNEKFRKMVNLKVYQNYKHQHSDYIDLKVIEKLIYQEQLGIIDLTKIENLIWKDLNDNSESFTFYTREINKKDICLSSFYTFETSSELRFYNMIFNKDKEDITEIFVSLFPHTNKSIFIMGIQKEKEDLVNQYINDFFSCTEKDLEMKITNLIMFQCETWIMSCKMYRSIDKLEEITNFCHAFSLSNPNERNFYDLNIFDYSFKDSFQLFKEKHTK